MKTAIAVPRLTLITMLTLASVAGACSGGSDDGPPAKKSAATSEHEHQPGNAPMPETAKVKVEAAGTEFKPPVHPDRIPGGAWICDMPTVHYAAMEKGTGKCPLCGMTLRHVPVDPDDHTEHTNHEGHEGHGATH